MVESAARYQREVKAVVSGKKGIASLAKRYTFAMNVARMGAAIGDGTTHAANTSTLHKTLQAPIPSMGSGNFLERFQHGCLLFKEPIDTLSYNQLPTTPVMLQFCLTFILRRWLDVTDNNGNHRPLEERLGHGQGESMPSLPEAARHELEQACLAVVTAIAVMMKPFLSSDDHSPTAYDIEPDKIAANISLLVENGAQIADWCI
jgi:hypothetical protein